MQVGRLDQRDEAALEELLDEDRVQNLFLRSFLASQGMERGSWYGARAGDRIRGVVLLLPNRLTVPWVPRRQDAADIGLFLRGRHPPTMMVGPRDDVDHVWRSWAPDVRPARFYHQRLYVCRTAPPGPSVPGFRKARTDEWPQIADHASRMELEDLGRDPAEDDAELHERVIKDRIAQGKTLVMERDGRIVFQINLGTTSADGCQVGGTYVPPRFRRRGLSIEGMRAAVRYLLRRYPLVSLHVNEANIAAVRAYERVGFTEYAPYRLLTVPRGP